MALGKRAALYVRVSTDGQTVENQAWELRQIAERRGWEIVETYSDAGISGAKGRDKRPGLDRMLGDAKRRRFDVVKRDELAHLTPADYVDEKIGDGYDAESFGPMELN